MKSAADWLKSDPTGAMHPGDEDWIRAIQADALEAAAKMAEDCIDNGVVVVSAGEVGDAIRALIPKPEGA